jgi:hypothetical protein
MYGLARAVTKATGTLEEDIKSLNALLLIRSFPRVLLRVAGGSASFPRATFETALKKRSATILKEWQEPYHTTNGTQLFHDLESVTKSDNGFVTDLDK